MTVALCVAIGCGGAAKSEPESVAQPEIDGSARPGLAPKSENEKPSFEPATANTCAGQQPVFQAKAAAQVHRTTVEGVTYELRTAWQGSGEDRYLGIWITARATDGLCHGIYDEASIVMLHSKGRGGMRGRRARSPCVYPIHWLSGDKEATLFTTANYQFLDMTLSFVEVGAFEVESSQKGMTLSPTLFRLDIDSDQVAPKVTPLQPTFELRADERIQENTVRCKAPSARWGREFHIQRLVSKPVTSEYW